MKRIYAIAACALVLPVAALAATRTYEVAAFDRVTVSAGITADITVGPARSVVAETRADDFDDLEITVKDNVLHIGRPSSSWFSGWFGDRTDYRVHVVTPALRSLGVSSGAEVTAKGSLEGDFSVSASSGADADVTGVKGGNVKAHSSSGSEVSIAGSCVSLDAHSSSGSDLDAEDLKCENASIHSSSGSEISVAAAKSVTGEGSSGSQIRVRGKPTSVQVDTSSGSEISIKE